MSGSLPLRLHWQPFFYALIFFLRWLLLYAMHPRFARFGKQNTPACRRKAAFLLKRYRILFCRQTGACLLFLFFYQNQHYFRLLATSTTCSTVKPNFLNRSPAGALAPKLSIAMILPSKPVYLSQPKLPSASTATRRAYFSRKYGLLVLLALLLEQIHTRHGDNADFLTFCCQSLFCMNRQSYLGNRWQSELTPVCPRSRR